MNSIPSAVHEFAGEIVKVGELVKDWKVGQRVVSDNSAHVCGVCPACEQGDFLCCENKVNLGLDNNTWGGGFSKYCKVPGEILRIHKHAIWEIPENVKYEEAAVLDPICNSYKAIAQQSPSPSGTGRCCIRDRTARVVRCTGCQGSWGQLTL